MVEALRTEYSVRQICETLGFTRSNLYYQPKQDPSETVLWDKMETLALRYSTYGYRCITKFLKRMGYTVGYKRVARLMKTANLSVSIKHVCQTTTSFEECVRGQSTSKTFRFVGAIRFGWAILPTSDSKDASSMFLYSWMSSLV